MKIKKLAAFLLIGMFFLSKSISSQAQILPTEFLSTEKEMLISPQWTNIKSKPLLLEVAQ